jgi:hypothetical protein
MTKDDFQLIERLKRAGLTENDAWKVRRIAKTLQRWHELECGDSNEYASWAIERDGDEPDSPPYLVRHHYRDSVWIGARPSTTKTKIPDRENGALRRLAAILANYPSLVPYVQSDPRGAALYICNRATTPLPLDQFYSRGVAVY